MTAISGVGGSSSAWSAMAAQREARQAKMFGKVDTDGSGGVDSTELQTVLDNVASKTGASAVDAKDLVAKYDTDGDGSLSQDELGSALKSVLPPPPSTMDFAQSRSGDASASATGDDLFSKVDTDGSGSLDASELQALMDKMSGDSGSSTSSTASSSTSSDAAAKRFAELDTDGDGKISQAEFEAGRPQGPPPGSQASGGAEGGGMHHGHGGGGGGGKVESASGSSDGSTSYDPLDTNQDGVVSAAELAAAGVSSGDSTGSSNPLEALFQAVDSDGNGKISESESDVLMQNIEAALNSITSSASTTAASSTSSTSSGSSDTSNQGSQDPNGPQSPFEMQRLAQLVLQQYEQVANNTATTTASTTLNAVA